VRTLKEVDRSMAVDHIRYDILAQEALRGVVRTVLVDAAKNGLPGDHHFYISFNTRADGVRLSPRMLAQYPKEMTLVLQHQFWDLAVTDDGFEVGVSFSGIPERLAVPFAAIKGFFDPSVQFGLQFEEIGEPDTQEGETESDKTPDKNNGQKPAGMDRAATRPPAEHTGARPAAKVPTPANPESADSEPTNSDPTRTLPDEKADKPEGGGEVVRLDRFRKK
jgi:uncharacterized protein